MLELNYVSLLWILLAMILWGNIFFLWVSFYKLEELILGLVWFLDYLEYGRSHGLNVRRLLILFLLPHIWLDHDRIQLDWECWEIFTLLIIIDIDVFLITWIDFRPDLDVVLMWQFCRWRGLVLKKLVLLTISTQSIFSYKSLNLSICTKHPVIVLWIVYYNAFWDHLKYEFEIVL